MGMNLDAILNIRANVQGGAQLQGLQDKISGVEAVTKKLTASSGILTGALGALAPIASIAGLGALIKGQIEAGDRMFDLSQKTGVSVGMLAKFDKAAKVSGTTLDSVAGGIVKLSKAMVAAAAGSGMGKAVEDDMKKAEEAIKRSERDQVRIVRDGERSQTQAVKDEADQRIEALQKESDKALDEIGKRYRRIETLLTRRFDDNEDKAARAQEKLLNQEQKALEREYEQRENAIKESGALSDYAREEELRKLSDDRETALDELRYRYADMAKERRRQADDAQQKAVDALNEQRQKEENVIKSKNEAQQRLVSDASESQLDILKKNADASVEAIKKTAEASTAALKKNKEADELSGQLEELGLSGKGASEAFNQLGISIKNSDGSLRSADDVMLDISDRFQKMPDGIENTVLATKLFGKSGADLIPMLNLGGQAINKMKVAMTEAFAEKADEYSDKMVILGGKVGGLARGLTVTLLPALTSITDAITTGVEVFSKLPEPIQKTLGGIVLLSMALGALKFTGILSGLGLLMGAFKALAGLQLAATFAGWAGAIGPAVAAITTALTGLIAWVGATLAPAMLAFFSGPVGWITLAVAAVIAGVVLFKEPIWKFLVWVGDTVKSWAGSFLGLFNDYVTKPLIGLWETIKTPISNLFTNISWLAGETFKMLSQIAYDFFVQPWVDLWEVVKEPVTATLTWIGDTMKTALNDLIAVSYIIFVEPWVQLWQKVKEPISSMLTWIKEAMGMAFEDLIAVSYIALLEPWVELWDKIKKPASDALIKIGTLTKTIFNGIIKFLYEKFVKPWQDIWKFLTQSPEAFKKSVNQSITDAIDGIVQKYNDLAGWLSRPFRAAGNLIAGAFNTILRGATDLVNALSGKINTILAGVNNASRTINTALKTNLPVVQMIPSVEAYQIPIDKMIDKMQETLKKEIGIPPAQQIKWPEPLKTPELDYSEITAAATGGWFGGPRIVKIGEGGDPGGEYAIPAQMMPAAMAAWNQGARGDALVSAMRSPGLAPGRSTTSPQSSSGARNLTINFQTGPVQQMADGSQWVQREELVALAEALMEATGDLNSSSAVRSLNGWG